MLFNAISMRHGICYRDNHISTEKRECDRKILWELNTLLPKDRREMVDIQLVRSIIGLKHRMGMGTQMDTNDFLAANIMHLCHRES